MNIATRKLVANLFAAVTLAGLAGVGAAACSSGTSDSGDTVVPGDPNVETTDTAEPAQDDGTVTFDTYMQNYGITDTTDAEYLAHSMCDDLDAGHDATQVFVRIALDPAPFTSAQAGTIVGAGTVSFCPDYTNTMIAIGNAAANGDMNVGN